MSDVVVVGIDPGFSGGLAALTLSGDVVEVAAMPVFDFGGKKNVDMEGLLHFFARLAGRHAIRRVGIEQVGAMPKQGVCSMFAFGRAYGTLIGFVGACGYPYELVPPKLWQKHVLSGMPPAKDTKTLSVAYCGRVFPGLSLKMTPRSRKPHDGVADAVCLAEYVRRIVAGGS